MTRSNLIPNLILNEKEFKTNEEKGKCFGELLSSIFSLNSDLIDTEKDFEILNSNSDFFRNNNQLKNEAASGPDLIHNLMYKKESDNLNLKIYGNRILNFNILVDEIKERCNKRLNIIKILSNKKWGLNQNTLSLVFNL
ncbi:hypothetical protein BpHYR1_018550 [Brachionus plicatilis]|uniref:RNA-directed DNA polymerase from mobile element jockey-like n=1 Tax=Brachionus plicatilis TaxID=10195 RepID=A0A3M7P9X2_BRAPC|nr:hypothetical protein BpHYR1_018550 [Brachionus plicatilis]